MDFNTFSEISENPLLPEKDSYKDTVLSLFKLHVEKNPNKVAVKMGTKNLTYQELDKISDKLAAMLVLKGLREDTPVGILLPRSLEYIVSIFGILKAGGGYAPMNPSDGEERLSHILTNCDCPFLLTHSKFLNPKLMSLNTQLLEIEIEENELIGFDDVPFYPQRIKPENLAYIIFTSGTTGFPKGVMIEHRNLFWYVKNYVPKIIPEDRVLQSMSITFDGSVSEIFPALCNGASLILPGDNISQTIREEEINYTMLTPSLAEVIDPKDIKTLKYIMIGGEKLSENVVKKFLPNVDVYNGYGPTEVTVVCSMTLIKNPKRIHIGGKLVGAELYVVNPDFKLCDQPNEIGELLIGGGGIGRGYYANPELTKIKFIKNPFGKGMIYRSGDLVKWNELGDLEYIGRADRQIKLRGFRMELDGIEEIINSFPEVTRSHLKIHNQNLIAYISPKNINLENLVSYLKTKLPLHAIPFKFIFIDNFPLNATGKINEKRLPPPNFSDEKKEFLPETLTEQKIETLWKKVLSIDSRISRKDNFFDLGGNSLNSLKLIHLMRKTYSNTNIPLELIYKNPKLEDFAKETENFLSREKKIEGKKEKVPVKEILECLPSTIYFVFGWIFPSILFILMIIEFPILLFYYFFELIIFKLFGYKIPPIFQMIRNKINFDSLNFKEVKIIETAPIYDPTGNIFCIHPHGLTDMHLQSLERYFYKRGYSLKTTFHNTIFFLPIIRTFLFLLGYIPANRKTFKYFPINKSNIFTTPGDVSEYLQCHEPSSVSLSTNELFFKLAIENGSTLIPVYAFNTENSFKFYKNLHGLRDKLKIGVKTLAIVPYSGKFKLPLPIKTNCHIVVGSPIKFQKNENPRWEDIQNATQVYSSALEKLHNTHRPNCKPDLRIN
jgi:amino acid adenylation domain-containing protein